MARSIARGMALTLDRDAQHGGSPELIPYMRDYIDALLRYATQLEQAHTAIVTDAMRGLEAL